MDQLNIWLPKADFVVGILPGTKDTADFFSKEHIFSKMKKSSVFMNIGRGSTVNEADLIEALETKQISGAVLDVFKEEPLSEKSPLWSLPNVLMTPHCADVDPDFYARSWSVFKENIELF